MIQQIQPPNWADILQGVGAIIGVSGAIVAFVLLFLKDKHKQAQLDNLKEISTKIEAQNETMQKSNELASEQIDVLRKMLLNPNDSGYEELVRIEEKKLRLSAMPNLKNVNPHYRMEEISVSIWNHGDTAIIERIDFLDSQVELLHNIKEGFELEKGQKISICGHSINGQNTNYMDYKIDLYFKDKLENNYVLKIERIYQSKEFRVVQNAL
jgi:hypothetical protein